MQLDDYLKDAAIRRSDFAKRLGVAPGTITDLCKGRRLPSLALLVRIIEITDGKVALNDFVPSEAAE